MKRKECMQALEKIEKHASTRKTKIACMHTWKKYKIYNRMNSHM